MNEVECTCAQDSEKIFEDRTEVDNILSTEQKLSLNRTYQSQEESLYKKYVTQLTPMVKDMTPEQAANYLADLGQKFMQEISR